MNAGIRYAVLSLMLISAWASAAPRDALWNFDGDQPDTIARDFTGEVGQWQVVKDTSAPSGDRVLAQLAQSSRSTFNVALLSTTALEPAVQDVEIGVSFRAVGGRIDQGGGPVWRARNANNYYIARYNPLEHNYRVYRVVEGRRTELASVDIAASPGWHHLRITMIGDRIRGYYDGKKYLDVLDSWFTAPGQVGLWTKADAQTHFDDFRVGAAGLGQRWDASFTSTAPEIDGVVDEVWERSTPLRVEVREAVGGHDARIVVLRALHTDDRLYVLAQWPDATRSDLRDPYLWNAAAKRYERPSKPDDQFALEFPLGGDFDVNMLAVSRDYVADVWHWKAGRGNPVGWVDDKRHIISQRHFANAREYSLGGRGVVYIARLADEGTPSYARIDPPTRFTGEVVDSFASQTPSGSLADVRGKGIHDGTSWTLEMSRAFDTHHDDDVTLQTGDEIRCAIAVLDDELYWRHSVSSLLMLHILPRTAPAARGP